MIVYIAAPYTQGDVALNVHTVLMVANQLVELGHTPYIPHLTHFWHLVSPKPKEFWLEYDKKFLCLCDCLLRLPGESQGADEEVEEANSLGMKVYYDVRGISSGGVAS